MSFFIFIKYKKQNCHGLDNLMKLFYQAGIFQRSLYVSIEVYWL